MKMLAGANGLAYFGGGYEKKVSWGRHLDRIIILVAMLKIFFVADERQNKLGRLSLQNF
jgi:hypothetical protein